MSDFWSNCYKKICQKSGSSDDIDMNLRPLTKMGKRNTATSQKFDGDVVLVNYDVIIVFSIYV